MIRNTLWRATFLLAVKAFPIILTLSLHEKEYSLRKVSSRLYNNINTVKAGV